MDRNSSWGDGSGACLLICLLCALAYIQPVSARYRTAYYITAATTYLLTYYNTSVYYVHHH